MRLTENQRDVILLTPVVIVVGFVLWVLLVAVFTA